MPSDTSAGPLGQLGDAILSWMLLIGGIAMALALGYVAYGVFFAADAVFGPASAQAGSAGLILNNLRLACTVMTVAALVLIAAGLGRYWGFHETGAILLLIGLGLLFGMPFLIGSATASYNANTAAPAKELLLGKFALTGALLAIAGGIQLLIQGIIAFVNRGARTPRVSTDISQGAFTGKKLERQDKFLGPCWTLPFCRDSAKRVCPVLNRRRPCWRDGHGCYCDQNIVLMLSGDRGRSAARSAQGFVSMQSLAGGRPKTSAEKRAQCLGCPIYLHRQNQKYRLLAPTTIAVVAGFFALNKLWIDEKYPEIIKNIGVSLNRFAFSSGPAGPQVPDWAQDLAGKSSVEWMVVLVIGLLLVSYLLHSLEWVLYKLGL